MLPILHTCGWRALTSVPLRDIEELLRDRLTGTLPGIEAQMRFAPVPAGAGWRAGHFPVDARRAAALVLLYPTTTGPAVALTVRSSGLARHPGQISLPGGAADPGETVTDTALREASEEIGVVPADVRVLGELTPVHVLVSGFTLHPLVGVTDRRPDFRPAPDEVEEILEVSLHDLRDASRIRQGIRLREGVAVEYPYFDLLGHQVWGATAMVLGEFICLLDGSAGP
jgi:8-oxo-dGTP pyrophosphatase MutT (NUDIX family)